MGKKKTSNKRYSECERGSIKGIGIKGSFTKYARIKRISYPTVKSMKGRII